MSKIDFFFDVAIRTAQESKYVGTRVGCVITQESRIVSIGCNGFAPSMDDSQVNDLSREDKLRLAIHAEENAILNAARNGINLAGSNAWVTHKPCIACYSRLKAAGIKDVCYLENHLFEAAWCDDHDHLYRMVDGPRLFPSEIKDRLSYSTIDRYMKA